MRTIKRCKAPCDEGVMIGGRVMVRTLDGEVEWGCRGEGYGGKGDGGEEKGIEVVWPKGAC